MVAGAKVYVAGHRGLVGSAIVRQLERDGRFDLVTRDRQELDLRHEEAVRRFFESERPRYVILAAARVGGIMANATRPGEFIRDNLAIQHNVLEAARCAGVEKLLFLGSSCIYPKHAAQPIREDSLLTGPLEPTNEAYAIAKIAGIRTCQAYWAQWGCRFISVMPTNLYGPNDNFDLATSHVLAALIRRFYEAKRDGTDEVVLWGTGTPRREFLHVDDLSAALLLLMERYDSPEIINVGTGQDIAISELAALVADVAGYEGGVRYDATKPDGTPRKLLDVSRIEALGWGPKIPLRDGVAATYEWFRRESR